MTTLRGDEADVAKFTSIRTDREHEGLLADADAEAGAVHLQRHASALLGSRQQRLLAQVIYIHALRMIPVRERPHRRLLSFGTGGARARYP